MTEFKGSRMFLNIPVTISRDRDLLKRPKSIILMGEIVSMLNITGKFFMSNKEIAARLDCTSRYVNNLLSLLEEKGLISRKIIYADDDHKIVKGRNVVAGPNLVNACSRGWGSTVQEGSEAQFVSPMKHSSSKENILREHNNRSINNLSPKPSHSENNPQPRKIKNDSERDKKLNQVINYYQKKLNENHPETDFNDLRIVTPLSKTEKSKLQAAIKPFDFQQLKQVIETASLYTATNPVGYLISCISNQKPRSKLTDFQKSLIESRNKIASSLEKGLYQNGFTSRY